MRQIYYMDKEYVQDIPNSASNPTANVISKFDSTAKMNSTDMTDAQIDAFMDDIPYAPMVVKDSVPIGAIQAFGGATAPKNWLICDGSLVSRTDYAKLFSVIGTTYGQGDGSTTFNLPDLRGRAIIGEGTGTATDATAHALGDTGGKETHTLTVTEMPSHSHNVVSEGYNVTLVGNSPASGSVSAWFYGSGGGSQTGSKGGSSAHNNMPPYVVTNYIIKYDDKEITGGGLEKIQKYLYESGTDDIWTYRKWADGTSECWGTYTHTTSHYTTALGGYAYLSDTINFPSNLFTDSPIVTYSGCIGNGFALTGTQTNNLTKNKTVLYAIATASGSQTCYWYIYAIGKWK